MICAMQSLAVFNINMHLLSIIIEFWLWKNSNKVELDFPIVHYVNKFAQESEELLLPTFTDPLPIRKSALPFERNTTKWMLYEPSSSSLFKLDVRAVCKIDFLTLKSMKVSSFSSASLLFVSGTTFMDYYLRRGRVLDDDWFQVTSSFHESC